MWELCLGKKFQFDYWHMELTRKGKKATKF